MRRVTIFIFLLIVINAHSDLPPLNYHIVNREILITHMDDYPEIRIFAYIRSIPGAKNLIPYSYIVIDNKPLYSSPGSQQMKTYIVEEINPFLFRESKSNIVELYAIEKNYIESIGNIKKIDFEEIRKYYEPARVVDTNGGVLPNENPLIKEIYYYKISKCTKTSLALKLYKRVLKYNDGSKDKVIEYE